MPQAANFAARGQSANHVASVIFPVAPSTATELFDMTHGWRVCVTVNAVSGREDAHLDLAVDPLGPRGLQYPVDLGDAGL